MDLSVVVISYNTRTLLGQCLLSIKAQVAELRHEIIVVDNASEDGSADMVAREFDDSVLIRNSVNRGFASAVNQAIAVSSGQYILLLNSDATLAEGSARSIVQELDEHPRVGAVGGTLLNTDGSFQGSYADFPTLLSETLLLTGLSRWVLPPTFPSHSASESQGRKSVDWVCGAFLTLRRAALDDVGTLDERYFMYAEEVDWCYRARQKGWEVVFLPEARAVHLVAGSYGRNRSHRRQQIYRSKWLYLQQHRGRFQAMLFRGLILVTSRAKLAAWALSRVGAPPVRRARAQENVASYRHLLRYF